MFSGDLSEGRVKNSALVVALQATPNQACGIGARLLRSSKVICTHVMHPTPGALVDSHAGLDIPLVIYIIKTQLRK